MDRTAAKSCVDEGQDVSDLETLRRRVDVLERENNDLELALETAVEHGDAVESDLMDLNRRLETEIKDRIQAENKLNMLVAAITQQRQDLEILVKTITEHSDGIDLEWLARYNQAEELSRVDGLTRIPNRRGFDGALEREWRRCARQRRSVSVLMCDVDWFKGYNDYYGHQAGDQCLATVARDIESVCRRPSDMPARYGGEEFAVLLPETGLEGAARVAEELRAALYDRGMPHAASPLGRMSISIGVASGISHPSGSPWDLVTEADRRLYAAKRLGRNRVVWADFYVNADL